MSMFETIRDDIRSKRISSGFIIRNSSQDPESRTVCAITSEDLNAHLLVSCSPNNQPNVGRIPTLRGFKVQSVCFNGVDYIAISVIDAPGTDMAKIAEAVLLLVAHEAPKGVGERQAAEAIVTSILKLQSLFTNNGGPLGPEARVGLFAELEVLKNWLIRAVGAESAIKAWTGPKAAPQDFQAEGCAIEVKATRSSLPQRIKISSERQLETRNLNRLFLVRFSIDEKPAQGVTLPQAVSILRTHLGSAPLALLDFDNLLTHVGYFDHHEAHYLGEKYAIRELFVYEVKDGFPRITESQLPVGLGKVSYEVDAGSCEPFLVSENLVLEALNVH
jgi:Putative  PD-(D/E)XK family member, (DUF4420)